MATEVKYYCDKCNDEIWIGKVSEAKRIKFRLKKWYWSREQKYLLCPECLEKLDKWLEGGE